MSEPLITVSIKLTEQDERTARALAAIEHDGSLSAYLRHLIGVDIEEHRRRHNIYASVFTTEREETKDDPV